MYASALSGREQSPCLESRKPTLHGLRSGSVLSDLCASSLPLPAPPASPGWSFESSRPACASVPPFAPASATMGERRSCTSARHFGVGVAAESLAALHASSSPLTFWIAFSLVLAPPTPFPKRA